MSPLFESSITSLPLIARGKVRDIYTLGDDHLLIITTDRLSAFDVILPDPIPRKGLVLTAMANFWFARLGHIIPNQLSGIDPEAVVSAHERQQVAGRALVVKRLHPLPIEAVVRGYLIGSGWKDYQANGVLCGLELPTGLKIASRFSQPLFTPASKAESGEHDENLSFAEAKERCKHHFTGVFDGESLALQARNAAMRLYSEAADFARQRSILIADTKFEFGVDKKGQLHLIDEVLTPDSSRFWAVDDWREGENPPSYDKQYVRDYLETLDWDKTPPAPKLPPEIIASTSARYVEACERLCGQRPA